MVHRWRTADKTTPAAIARARQYATPQHRNLRAHWRRQIDLGNVYCWRCTRWIPPGSEFHLGHDDNDRRIYRGPEHPQCNLRAAARAGNAKQRQRKGRRAQSRAW